MNNPIDELETLLTELAEHAPRGVSRARVAHRVSVRRRRHTAVRITGGVACVAALAGGVVTVQSRASANDGALGRVTTVAGQSTAPTLFPISARQAQNFLIVGSDANACVDDNSPWADVAESDLQRSGNRSDTILVMRIDPATRQAATLSFPRDLWVKLPARAKSRIDSAYIKDDPRLLQQTLYDNFGITIDHYLQIDLCAFKHIIDAVGGVSVPFDTPLRDGNVGLDIGAAGCHVFNGDEALAYVRSRRLEWIDENGVSHRDASGDLGRIARQQDFVGRVLGKAISAGLFDPSVARALIESLQEDIVTDQGFTIEEMMRFAGALKDIEPSSIQQYQVDATTVFVSGSSVLEPQLEGPHMQAVLRVFQGIAQLDGSSIQPANSTSSPTGSQSSDVSLPEVIEGQILPTPNIEC